MNKRLSKILSKTIKEIKSIQREACEENRLLQINVTAQLLQIKEVLDE